MTGDGSILRAMREARGLTRDELGRRCDVSESAIQVNERDGVHGRRWLPNNAKRIALALHAAMPLSPQELSDFSRIVGLAPDVLIRPAAAEAVAVHQAQGVSGLAPVPSRHEAMAVQELLNRLVSLAGYAYTRAALEALIVSVSISATPSAASAAGGGGGGGPTALVTEEQIGSTIIRRYDPANPPPRRKRGAG